MATAMRLQSRVFGLILAIAEFAFMSETARADVAELVDGGLIRGECLKRPPTEGLGNYVFQTLGGAVVEFPSEEVARFIKRRKICEEFEVRLESAAGDAIALWAVAEWAREQGLRPERARALEALVAIDPANVAAHRGLGHIQQDGQWMSRDEANTARGLVKHKGKWVLPQEVALLEEAEAQSAEEKEWYRSVKQWHTWLRDVQRPERQTNGLAQLRAISAPAAVPAVARHLGRDPEEQVRLLATTIYAQIAGEAPTIPLVNQVLQDVSAVVRASAIGALRDRDPLRPRQTFQRALKHELNIVVNRAGAALGVLGADEQVPALIDALVTEHRYTITVQDPASTIGIRSDGLFAPTNTPVVPPEIANLLATGQLPQGVNVQRAPLPGENMRTKNVTILRKEQNPDVLDALGKLTGQNFGFDETTWKTWWRRRQATVKDAAT
jgi:hypothetical protein